MTAMDRRAFLATALAASAGALVPTPAAGQPVPPTRGRPKPSEFAFARLRYTSGDWDYNPKVAGNVLNSLVEYTSIPVYPEEVVITADSSELAAFPFLFMTGHTLVRFSSRERDGLQRFVDRGGLLFSDDCNHDVSGLYAVTFEREMRTIFPGTSTLAKLPGAHPLYSAFFAFPDGPPQTSHELNGWGDESGARLPARRRTPRSSRRRLFQQGLRLRMGLRLAQQALPARGQHHLRGEPGGVRPHGVSDGRRLITPRCPAAGSRLHRLRSSTGWPAAIEQLSAKTSAVR